MQFQDAIANDELRQERFNCASCKGQYHKCLHPIYGKREIEIEEVSFEQAGQRQKRKIRSADDVWDYVDWVQSNRPNTLELEIVYFSYGSGICPVWIIDHMTIEMLNMIDICEKYGFPFDGGYFDQPSQFIQTSNIVSSERAKLLKMRTESGRKR